MKSKSNQVDPLASGEDSFLDIVANLVGVLIILVAIVSLQAKSAAQQSIDNTIQQQELETLKQCADVESVTARKYEAEIDHLDQAIEEEEQLTAKLTARRHEQLVRLETTRRQLQEKIESATAEQQTAFEIQQRKQQLQQQLQTLQQSLATQKPQPAQRETIEHYPTPIAKTVFSNEVHYRLSHGRLVLVPIDELLQAMKSEWKVKAEKLLQQPNSTEMVGPIDGFRMQYELVAETTGPFNGPEAAKGIMVRFNHFQIIPEQEIMGELYQDAIADGSQFRQWLDRMPADKTTVSVWVYPDSFREFGELKTWLRQRGYQIAGWPLSEGKLISGGPNGLRTSAQ